MHKLIFTGAVTAGILLALVFLAMGCGEAPTTPTPTLPSPAVVTLPSPAPPVVAVEPFCPAYVTDFLQASYNNDRLQVSWNMVFSASGDYLKRYQVQVENDRIYEVEITRLSGPHGKTATVELKVRGPRVRVRAWFPDECHGDSNQGSRLNSQWSEWREVSG